MPYVNVFPAAQAAPLACMNHEAWCHRPAVHNDDGSNYQWAVPAMAFELTLPESPF